MSRSNTYVEACLRGEAIWTDIDDWVDAWHESGEDIDLHEFLGMSWDEYSLWVERPQALRGILAAHHGSPEPISMDTLASEFALAARSNSDSAASEVLDWLRSTGRIV